MESRLDGFDLFELMEKLWSKCIVTSSNYGGTNEKIVKGLVCGHAYRKRGEIFIRKISENIFYE